MKHCFYCDEGNPDYMCSDCQDQRISADHDTCKICKRKKQKKDNLGAPIECDDCYYISYLGLPAKNLAPV